MGCGLAYLSPSSGRLRQRSGLATAVCPPIFVRGKDSSLLYVIQPRCSNHQTFCSLGKKWGVVLVCAMKACPRSICILDLGTVCW
jgi:hypothetical protein